MKKPLISLNILLALFFAGAGANCEEVLSNFPQKQPQGLYIGVPFNDTKNKMTLPNPKTPPQTNQPTQKEEEKGIFSFFKKNDKFKPVKKYNPQTNRMEEVPQGYYGTLPDIERDFRYKKQKISSPRQIEGKIPDEGDLEDENLKPAPFDDTLFLDVIIKKDKTSTYVNDLQKTKFALNNLKKCIEEDGNIQRFNGCVNVLDLHVQNLKSKYGNRSESLKESYSDILNTNYHCKVVGNLIYDSNYYARYIPTQQGKYSKENIEAQKKDLLNRINKTLFIIANES